MFYQWSRSKMLWKAPRLWMTRLQMLLLLLSQERGDDSSKMKVTATPLASLGKNQPSQEHPFLLFVIASAQLASRQSPGELGTLWISGARSLFFLSFPTTTTMSAPIHNHHYDAAPAAPPPHPPPTPPLPPPPAPPLAPLKPVCVLCPFVSPFVTDIST